MFDNNQVSNQTEAYLLGFLYADGYVTGEVKGRYYVLGISLSQKDASFLEAINTHLHGNIVQKTQGKYLITKLTKCDVRLTEKLLP